MAEILVNVRPTETRVAYVESGLLRDIKIERKASPTLVGAIYRARVSRVLPGMQAAFVDIGLDRAAFLYVADVRSDLESTRWIVEDEIGREDAILIEDPTSMSPAKKPAIQELLSEGQDILIQVAKDPIGTKGARVTTHVSLAGRNIVYMPTVSQIGISRRITDPTERERLRKIILELKPRGGVILRTAGEGANQESLAFDIEYLDRLWMDIFKRFEKRKSPGLVHAELDVILRALRDLLNETVEKVLVDDYTTHKHVLQFVTQFMPQFKTKIIHYHEPHLLFDFYDIEMEISRSVDRKIWLKSGGYIVIDEAEALVVIDVNTGKFTGKRDFEDTILKTNLEAVREIVHQLAIRNCGGIIIIDFIDMEKLPHREKVLESLQEELGKDRARTQIFGMSDIGLVQMTRKRIRPSLVKTLCEPCFYCEGKGFIKRRPTVAHEIFREIERDKAGGERSLPFVIHCHGKIADWIYEEENEMLEYIENKLGRSVVIKVEPYFHLEQFDIRHGHSSV